MRPKPGTPRFPVERGSLQMLLVSPGAEQLRGVSGYGYSNLPDIYDKLNLTVIEVSGPRELEKELAARQYDLLLIPSRLTFRRQLGEPILDAGGVRARSLSSMLRGEPIVIWHSVTVQPTRGHPSALRS
jgi:hypothetical protein